MRRILVDTNAFFRGKEKFLELVERGYKLVTCTIVIYEFLKVIDELIVEEKDSRRKELYMRLKNRFPGLLEDLEIEILDHKIDVSDIRCALSIMKEKSIDIGDALIYLLLRKENIQEILTYDEDWKRLDIKVVQ